jgi:hypothetical protein
MRSEIRRDRTASTSTGSRTSARRLSRQFCPRAASAGYSLHSLISSSRRSTRRYTTRCSATARRLSHSESVPTTPPLLGKRSTTTQRTKNWDWDRRGCELSLMASRPTRCSFGRPCPIWRPDTLKEISATRLVQEKRPRLGGRRHVRGGRGKAIRPRLRNCRDPRSFVSQEHSR